MEFVDAVYIAPKGGTGRSAEPNPFTEIISQIALKRVTSEGKQVETGQPGYDTGKPVAKSCVFEHAKEPVAKGVVVVHDKARLNPETAKIKRQLSAAGNGNTPPVTVVSAVTSWKDKNGVPSAVKSVITFWTVPLQKRPRKPKPTTPVEAPADK